MKSKTFNRTLSKCALTILAALTFVGCSDYDNGFTEQQISFIKNFKEIYGEVDPTQDWNLAERATVTVTTSSPSNIKIYAKTNGKYKIVGDYEDVSGTQTLGFDVVEGTKDIMVSDGRTAQHTTVGGSAIFGSTRIIYTENDDDIVNISTTEDYYEIDQNTYLKWRNYIPEHQFNLGKVNENFVYISSGEFVIYPIYWNTSNTNTLGIYYFDKANIMHYVDIYQIKDNTPADCPVDENGKQLGEIQVCENYIKGSENNVWENAPCWGFAPYDIESTDGPDAIRARGIKINMPEGTVFGMYIRNSGNTIFHSNNNRNKAVGVGYDFDENGDVIISSIKNKEGTKASYAATFIDNGKMYLGFEDWPYGGGWDGNTEYVPGPSNHHDSDFDLNDCMFMFGENIPELLIDGAEQWIISAEDLGNTLDIDYNDVVLEVEYVSGRTTASVTPLAAGGTLASYVYFGKEPVGKGVIGSNGKEKTGEIHELFSGDHAVAKSGNYTPINVGIGGDKFQYSKRTYPITVPRDFSLASKVPGGPASTMSEELEGMGGFNIWVLQQGVDIPEGGLTLEMITKLKSEDKIVKIENFKLGSNAEEDNVPYAICTPKYWSRDGLKGHYRWPEESVPMLQTNGNAGAYEYDGWGEGSQYFKNWVANKNNDTQWYQYPNPSITIAPTGISDDIDDDDMFDLQDPEFNITINNDIIMALKSPQTIINYTTSSNGAITVSCNPDDIVDVKLVEGSKNITITPKNVGSTIVTITQAAHGNYYGVAQKLNVTVVEKYDPNFSVNQNNIDIEKGEVTTVSYSTQSDGKFDFKWSDDNIASVEKVDNQLKITGLKGGETTLTITQEATDLYYSAEQTITVKVTDYSDDILETGKPTDLTKFLSIGKIPASIFQNLESKITITIMAKDEGYCDIQYIKISNVKLDGYTGDYQLQGYTQINQDSPFTKTYTKGETIGQNQDIIEKIKESGIQIQGGNITLEITIE